MPSVDTPYDTISYPSYSHPQTHPERLAVIGSLFGMKPASVAACRVLELGCGDGANLASMAWGLPQSEFVGIDLANNPVRQGQEMIRELEMSNIRLVQGDLSQINAEWGRFDYLIAHGLFSWVPTPVQERVFELCRETLAPQGIAYISYNALPGGHIRTMLREMMHFHTGGCQEPQQRIAQALSLVRFLAQGQVKLDEYGHWTRAELERMLKHAPGHLYHDELADINEPFYFTQFVQRASAYGLQYLGEADYFEMSDHIFPEPTRQTLAQLGTNRILREQYMDFLKCRRFRQTLLCRREATVLTQPKAEAIAEFLLSSNAVPQALGAPASSPREIGRPPDSAQTPGSIISRGEDAGTPREVDLRPGVTCVFQTPKGAKCETNLPMGKAALSLLGSVWPGRLSFRKVFSLAQQRLAQADSLLYAGRSLPLPIRGGEGRGDEAPRGENSPQMQKTLCGFLLELYAAGIVDFHTVMPPAELRPGPQPKVYPLARWQAVRGDCVTSLFHIAVQVQDDIGRKLLNWLDGTKDRPALLAKLRELPGQSQEPAALTQLEKNLESNLWKLAGLGLLVETRCVMRDA